jgi:hypothetical protein
MPRLTTHRSLDLPMVALIASALGACASTVVPGDGAVTDAPTGSDVPSTNDVTHLTDVASSDVTGTYDGSGAFDGGPTMCPIVGTYSTNGGLIMQLEITAGLTYSADNGRFVGRYLWDGRTLTFFPGPGSTSTACASRGGSSVTLTFDDTCRTALVVTVTDSCTGEGLLTRASSLTRQ